MKKIVLYFTICIIALASCSKENLSDSDETVSVKLNIGGEITDNYSPLTKSENNDLIGIVIETHMHGVYNFFNSGLFDNTTNIVANLKKDINYKIYCVYIKDGKTTVANDGFTGDDRGYREPFYNESGKRPSVSNKFEFESNSAMRLNTAYNASYSKNQDTYYFEIDDYLASPQGTLNLNLKHTAFGLKYTVEGLTDGYLIMTISRDNETLFSASDISSNGETDLGIIRCLDIESAFEYPDTYAETAKVSLIWMRGINVEEDLGSVEIKLKRNMLNNVKINLSAKDEKPNFNVDIESTGLTDDDIQFELK